MEPIVKACAGKISSKPSLEDWQHIATTAQMMAETYGRATAVSWIEAAELIASHLGFQRVSLGEAFADLSSQELGYE